VWDYDPSYYDETYDLSKIESVDFIVETFGSFRGMAHTLLSFGFSDGKRVAISVETRREKGETYNVFKGMTRHYELIYVIGDENDLVKLRTNYRNDPVYLYEVITTPEKVRALFVDMLTRANYLAENPQFYHTVWNNCTTNIVKHVNRIASSDKKVPLSIRYILPGYSAKLAYEVGLLDTGMSFDELKNYSFITEKAQGVDSTEDFSEAIRVR
jgi:hypothetical protein